MPVIGNDGVDCSIQSGGTIFQSLIASNHDRRGAGLKAEYGCVIVVGERGRDMVTTFWLRHALIITLIALIFALTPALAASSLQGQWRGSGVVTHRKAKTAVRCRVSFYKLSATAFSLAWACSPQAGRQQAN